MPYPKIWKRVPTVLSEQEVRRLLDGASRTATPQRDVALVQFLIQTGCRAGEATGLELGTMDWARHVVHKVLRIMFTLATRKEYYDPAKVLGEVRKAQLRAA
ncbi:tyrosine-type recombinase/integrase [Limnochorda pilosa]|uniref:tyrosine-type recombinase/integrase n=1 Tax=Limnochorda pilosa TaxID=1555112 RepID=UPI00130D52F2|nr:tyrosine-type recombinase/integrase [Limnochorda pilosa]